MKEMPTERRGAGAPRERKICGGDDPRERKICGGDALRETKSEMG